MKSIRCIARAKDAAWGMYNVPSPKAARKEGFRYSAGISPEKTIPPSSRNTTKTMARVGNGEKKLTE